MQISQVVAPNPGLLTGAGTNTWIVESEGRAAVIDPGPELEQHRQAIIEALGELEPVGVLVTHCHPDHALLANRLADTLRVPAMGGCPGPGFKPDRRLVDGDAVEVGAVLVVALHTPGHTAHHLCYRVGDALFTGDLVMGGTTVLIEHMADYLESLRKVQGTGLKVLYPGHGEPMPDPESVLADYLEHRLGRERQILAAVREGAPTIGEIVERVYEDVDVALYPLAARSVAAHLRKLCEENLVVLPQGSADWSSPVHSVSVSDSGNDG